MLHGIFTWGYRHRQDRTFKHRYILLWIVSIIINKHLACIVLKKWFISIFFHYFQRIQKNIHIFVVVVRCFNVWNTINLNIEILWMVYFLRGKKLSLSISKHTFLHFSWGTGGANYSQQLSKLSFSNKIGEVFEVFWCIAEKIFCNE